jgi:hypothetical protein
MEIIIIFYESQKTQEQAVWAIYIILSASANKQRKTAIIVATFVWSSTWERSHYIEQFISFLIPRKGPEVA